MTRDSITVLAEQEKLGQVIAAIQDGWVLVGRDRRLQLVNPAAREALGLPPQAALAGQRFEDVFPQPELLALIASAEDPRDRETEISRADGRVYRVQARWIAGVGWALIVHDITEFTQRDQLKTEFVHTLSHDLRSPLTAIMGYVELIERAGPVTDLQRDFIRRVHTSVQNITRLMDDLLYLGRIESRTDLHPERLCLEQIARRAAEEMLGALAGKNQQLRLQFPADFPVLLADPLQMRQMMAQLLDNAHKYSPPGATITVSGELASNHVILRVSDPGIGIPVNELPLIFEKFYRASNASSEIAGTGLGLAIVRSVVERHAGRVWADSTLGVGSVFTILLPALQA